MKSENKNVRIKNYRLLKDVSFSIDEKQPLLLGVTILGNFIC